MTLTRDLMDGISVYLQYFLQTSVAVSSGAMLWHQLICKQDILLQAWFCFVQEVEKARTFLSVRLFNITMVPWFHLYCKLVECSDCWQ